jgi:CRISPR-associated exonuclease Cas4
VQNELARGILETLRDLRHRLRFTTPALLLAEAIERLRIRAIVAGRSADQATRSLANVDGLLERARNYGVRGFVQFARELDDDWSTGTGFAEGIVEADGRSIELVTVIVPRVWSGRSSFRSIEPRCPAAGSGLKPEFTVGEDRQHFRRLD